VFRHDEGRVAAVALRTSRGVEPRRRGVLVGWPDAEPGANDPGQPHQWVAEVPYRAVLVDVDEASTETGEPPGRRPSLAGKPGGVAVVALVVVQRVAELHWVDVSPAA
jgi:hypothetical protein